MTVALPLPTIADISRRRYQRVRMSVPVVVAGQTLRTLDWSVGGFRLPTPVESLGEGQAVAEMLIPAEDMVFHFSLAIEHIHADVEQGFVGYRFVDLGEEQHDLLRGLVVSAVTGGCYPLRAILQAPFALQALAEAQLAGQSLHPRLGFAITRP